MVFRQPEIAFSGCLFCLRLGLQLPIHFQHDVARFAIKVIDAHGANAVVFIITLVAQVSAHKANCEIVVGFVAYARVNQHITALSHVPQAVSAALRGDAAVNRPFLVVKRQAVAGKQAEHVARRVFAEIRANRVIAAFVL